MSPSTPAGDAVRSYLRACVPTIPSTFGMSDADLLFECVNHADAQAVVMAVMNRAPHLDRRAFQRETTFGDIVAWLSPMMDREEPESTTVARPRGSYSTQATTLRPIVDQDIESAYRSSFDPRSAHRWRFRGVTVPPEEFRRVFFSPQTIAQFAVIPVLVTGERARSNAGIGVVTAYDADFTNGHCFIAFERFLDRDIADVDGTRGMMVEGLPVFIQYLFDHFTLTKIYIDVPEFSLSLFEQGADRIFEREGTLRRHYFYGDRWWDRIFFALYRERWDEVAEPFRGVWER